MKNMRNSERSTTNEVLRFSFPPQATGRKILSWYGRHSKPWPWRELWTEHRNPWHVWVSEIMLQQTVIKAVLPVYDRFLRKFPEIEDFANADEEEVRQTVQGLGYYRRFGLLHKAAKQLLEYEYPDTFEGWKELPGVGDYTAAAISSICYDIPVAVVDGNVERVLCRLLDWQVAPNDPKLKPEFKRLANMLLPVGKKTFYSPGDYNQGIMELGQSVCTGTPLCDDCPVNDRCLSFINDTQHLAPAPKIKKAKIDLVLRLGIHRRGKKVALYQRPDSAKFLKGTWGFLTEIKQKGRFLHDGGWSLSQSSTEVLGEIKHNITNHRLRVHVRSVRVQRERLAPIKWVPIDEVDRYLVSNLDRKAWKLKKGSAD